MSELAAKLVAEILSQLFELLGDSVLVAKAVGLQVEANGPGAIALACAFAVVVVVRSLRRRRRGPDPPSM